MEPNTCQAIKRNGQVCGKRRRPGEEWCGLHLNMHGRNPALVLVPAPEDIERRRQAEALRRAREIRFRHRTVWHHVSDALFERMNLRLGVFDETRRALHANQGLEGVRRVFVHGIFEEMNRIVAGIYDGTLMNPIVDAVVLAERIRRDAPGAPPRIPAVPPPMPQIRAAPVGELARFVQDNQNVHTVAAVQQTKDVVDRVLRIAVPEDYRSPSLKTMGEIVLSCPMTKKAAQQFTAKYCMDEDIYEYGAGIYARVADSVWQYIKNSPDKESLCRIFADEMSDSIGMCAQGNLTRLCNVLAGYLEGVNMQSQAEKLQNKMARIAELENAAERLAQGRSVLRELNVPAVEWNNWLDALA
jgi:hypothetical protein